MDVGCEFILVRLQSHALRHNLPDWYHQWGRPVSAHMIDLVKELHKERDCVTGLNVRKLDVWLYVYRVLGTLECGDSHSGMAAREPARRVAYCQCYTHPIAENAATLRTESLACRFSDHKSPVVKEAIWAHKTEDAPPQVLFL